MAKKTSNVSPTTKVEETIEEMVAVPKTVKKDSWVIEDKVYYLTKKKRPLSYMIKSAGVYYFDEEKGFERELKYCENQITPFVDEMKGDQRLSHIIFRNGALHVPRNKQTLQKLLSLYHPDRDQLFFEYKPVKEAEDEMVQLELEADAILAARNMDIDMSEAILRTELGSGVSKMSSKEIKRDILIFAKYNPQLFLDLAQDENVTLRNFGIKAVEAGILALSQDQRHFMWSSNRKKLMTVPYEEHPYSALAAWFKTDEGMEIYTNIEKRLNN
tara:strand:- start:192 stop:1007 length:816 start_codon:yes stop_codon:yes gene_type:complete